MSRLTCSQWVHNDFRGSPCGKDANWYSAKGEPTLQDLYCNIHKGGFLRKRWNIGNGINPLTDGQRTKLLKDQAVVDQKEAEKQAQERLANEEHRAKYIAQDWAEVALTASFKEVDKSDEWRTSYEYHVILEGQVIGSNWNTRRAYLEQPTEKSALGRAAADPARINLSGGRGLTPNEARAMADALRVAADRADQLNVRVPPPPPPSKRPPKPPIPPKDREVA